MSATESKCRVLVVDDCPDTSVIFAHMFKLLGAEVVTAINGELGMSAAASAIDEGRPFQLILMDVKMPDINGLSAAKLLRKEGFDGLIVACTATSSIEEREDSRSSGIDVYFDKRVANKNFFSALVDRATSKTPKFN